MITNQRVKRHLGLDAIAIVILAILAIWLFRFEFQGYVWTGNPDRLNSALKITQHYLAHIPIQAWNEHEMMGYDSFALPYIYPHFLLPILKWFGLSKQWIIMGYISIGLLIAAGVAAYICIRAFTGTSLATLTAAICYQLSSLTVLKVSQNAMTFCVYIVIPLSIWCLKSARRENLANQFIMLSILLSLMLGFMFLQTSAYAVLFLGLYAFWLSWSRKAFYPCLLFSICLFVAIIFAGSRIFGVFEAMKVYSRVLPGRDFTHFNDLYLFQHIYPIEIFRWFDANIFGRFPSDVAEIKNNINLTEGFLIYTAGLVPFLLIWGAIRFFWDIKHAFFRSEFLFFSLILMSCFLVIICPLAAKGLYLLFLKVDFTPARVFIIGLMALVILLSAELSQISPNDQNILFSKKLFILVISVCFAALLYYVITYYANHGVGYIIKEGMHFSIEAIRRIEACFAVFVFLSIILSCHVISFEIRKAAYDTLCFLIIFQCMGNANLMVHGAQNFNVQAPFYKGDMYYARKQEFIKPTPKQILTLQRRIQPNLYRVALICDQNLAGGFCAGHVPEYWNLRTIDGYDGIGVPKRILALPWSNGVDLGTLSFDKLESIPWKLLGFLNVKYVLDVKDGLYRNIISEHNQIISLAKPNSFSIISSPERVTPRVFFAKSVQSVRTPDDAVQAIFKNNNIINPEEVSFAENFDRTRFSHEDSRSFITISGGGDDLFVRFNPDSKERFLVLNELYFPGWQAEASGKLLPIYPTNVVMRGVVIPPLANYVHFHYTPMSRTLFAKMWQITALALLIMIYAYLKNRPNLYFGPRN